MYIHSFIAHLTPTLVLPNAFTHFHNNIATDGIFQMPLGTVMKWLHQPIGGFFQEM